MANRTHFKPLAALVVAAAFAMTLLSVGVPAGASGSAIAVDPGGTHTCALTGDSELRCWGWNFHGQIGDGTFESRLKPATVDLPGVTAFAAGGNHTCAVSEGRTLCWGLNGSGQLGDGTFETRATPVAVAPTGYVSLAAGSLHTCAITREGTVECWGANESGQLGNGQTEDSATPVMVCSNASCTPLGDVTLLALGTAHTCALSGVSGLLCWGSNEAGQIGDGGDCSPICARPMPVCLPGLSDGGCAAPEDIVSISAGGSHTCAVTSDNRAYCWGDNSSGQVGDGAELSSDVPVLVSGLAAPVAIAAGLSHTCALSNAGGVSCWGLNSVGQLGNGSGVSASFPIAVEGLALEIIDIAAGGSHTCGVTESGALRCWGWNADGRLGDGTFSNRDGPVDVIGFGSKTATATPTAVLLPGDVDCDQDISAIDATLILQLSASLIDGLACENQADVTADGRIDSIDAAVVLQHVAGLVSTLPP